MVGIYLLYAILSGWQPKWANLWTSILVDYPSNYKLTYLKMFRGIFENLTKIKGVFFLYG